MLLVAGAFWVGRVSAKNSLPEKKNTPNQPKDSPQPRKPNHQKSPTNPNELQFTVYYFTGLGSNHM